MNGPDHYREAERLLAEAVAQVPVQPPSGDPWQAVPRDDDAEPKMEPKYDPVEAAAIAALAQVHATLAAAAASALQARLSGQAALHARIINTWRVAWATSGPGGDDQ